jgi:hypothetical protein
MTMEVGMTYNHQVLSDRINLIEEHRERPTVGVYASEAGILDNAPD